MQKNVQALIGDISSKCIKNGINFRLEYKSQVDEDNLPCSGYFDENSLVVGVKKSKDIDWIDVLVHESCHLDQFLEKTPLWVSDALSLNIVESWIEGKAINNQKALTGFKNTVALELDCEKRTVKKLQKYKIKFNKSLYIQKANAYLFSYAYALINKKWYAQPYENVQIVRHMPTFFLTLDKYLDVNSKYLQYFK
jgi:hypothetical protein